MKTLKVNTPSKSYLIYFSSNTFNSMDELLKIVKKIPSGNVLLLTDKKIFSFYSGIVKDFCSKLDAKYIILPVGEKQKSLKTANKIYTFLLENNYHRNTILIAFGGGVIGDLTGFIASTYMRGVRFIQVPTTLLAQVDSSVGGKVAVNHPLCKNSIGAFYQPEFVYINLNVLNTLSKKDYLSGLGEVIKYGLIKNRDFFFFLKENKQEILNRNISLLEKITYISCKIKSEIVSKDEKEKGLRTILNLGHTLGHAIESASKFKIMHGKSISIGTVFATYLSKNMGILKEDFVNLLYKMYKSYGIIKKIPYFDEDLLISLMLKDKKNFSEGITFVLPVKIGEVIVQKNISPQIIRENLVKFYREFLK